MSGQMNLDELWRRLRECGSVVERILDHLAPELIGGRPLREGELKKNFNDPIWKTITLDPVEVHLLDMRLMQRLRGVRQLGLAHLVYPSAQHSRFEHSLGAIHVADRMVKILAPGTDQKFLRAIRIAALLHDCGHTVFSHVGERALNRDARFSGSFAAAKDLLNTFFDDPAREQIQQVLANSTIHQKAHALAAKAPPAAEIVSALLILSPSMMDLGPQLRLSCDDLLRAASLVVGRPHKLVTDDGRAYADYVKSIVSSDLDADKLDYVARDAYVAGIPIAADVDRLMSQLTLVDCRLSESRPMNSCRILAVLPSGVASVEMFIMTRAYLFSRVYQHPKIRLAETVLERRLCKAIQARLPTTTPLPDARAIDSVLDLLYGLNGDDACLEVLDNERGDNLRVSEQWRRARRVLALSPRLVHGFDEANGQPNRLLDEAWSPAATQIQQDASVFESAVAEIIGIDKSLVIVDWQRQANIKENPAVFVADQFRAGEFVPLSKAFDIGQLAAAFEDVKSVAWVFADVTETERAAAAAAIASTNMFGLVPTRSGVAQAKVNPETFIQQVQSFSTRGGLDQFAAKQVERVHGSALAIPHAMVKNAFRLPNDDALIVAARLGSGLITNSRRRRRGGRQRGSLLQACRSGWRCGGNPSAGRTCARWRCGGGRARG